MFSPSALLAALVVAATPSPDTAAMHTTPSGHYAVEVSIRGEGPWPFIVDTGASHTAIVQPLAEHFGFVSRFERTDDVQALTNRFRAERFLLEEVRFGRSRLAELDTVVVPIAPDAELSAYGLLGADAFGEGRIAIDFARSRLELDAEPTSHDDARIDPQTGLVFATARLSGVRGTVNVLVDSGSPRTMVNRELARRLNRGGVVISMNVGGVTGSLIETEAVRLERVRLGGLCVARVAALEAELDIFTALGWQDEPAMVAGLDVIGDSRILIDRGARTVQLDPGPGGPECRSTRIQREAS
ncbi:hypothetical protein E5163_15780 [Marinicauda algicola]|uniref:Peptidase A2 domain-containing protein n=1 Tax=Marinicauda algicola TaxID=2029849 RepID=A0A4S2GWQ9_9PROT|nr:aspartyl protease family protein [Marinicauda algicola]TGY87182.1 hypothetical protein E5163_15780 [Marinicauda algicola]